MARPKSNNTSILEYALRHLESERDEIQAKIDHVRRQLGAKVAGSAAAPAAPAAGAVRKRRTLSAAARKRIAVAQKKRWAEQKKEQAKALAKA